MKEARLILMQQHALAFQTAMESVVKEFGGATNFGGTGWWGGTVENITVVDVAYEPGFDNDTKLYDIADAYRLNADQQEVYLRYGNGHVQMVTAASCMENGEFDWETLRKEMHEPEDDLTDTVAA